ncbi:7,8-didemethyl-8-hydroxy-5-deazariboflavin synthase CofG [Subtercola lobariae]|uniref:7,8-didemethyl-8-hydroxy-5-deazariboflavin synthase n=1 Tax=Subtercola lobariae TaxID=1588641 RepID=A0A917AYK7_9MICO|nr:7,8-didemethyl-8-hydroxy-5-deazariboflavin synthase CofG [Subtercola lobariae]GGF10755.1 FO synthase [Subtercola lobariae]
MPAVRLPAIGNSRTIAEPAVSQAFTPSDDAIARALVSARAETPDAHTAETLLHARGRRLEELLDIASALRDEGLAAAGRPRVITYSRKVFIPLTHLCQDRCHYCIFVSTPGKLAKEGKAPFLPIDEVIEVARQGAAMGCKEALFTLGDRPENRWPAAREWLDAHGYDSTLDYVRDAAEQVLAQTGLLPHLNPGVMTWAEMQRLKPVGPSMGMMLETTATRLWSEKSGAHYGSPDKDPAVRLRVLDDAGRSKIPFTTGVLFGIGENYAERVDSMLAIRASARLHGHIQETIVQNFRAKDATAMMHEIDLETEEYIAAVAVTRLVMGANARIQAPPNLTDAAELALLIRAGIDDWGGVSPLTPDHVNPERPWPQIDELARLTSSSGFELRERLTAHPHFVREPEEWIDEGVLPAVLALADASGLARADARPQPVGQAELAPRHSSVARDSGFAAVLAAAERTPAELDDADYVLLLSATEAELDALTDLADSVRETRLGSTLTYAVNRNLDATLVRARRGDATGVAHTLAGRTLASPALATVASPAPTAPRLDIAATLTLDDVSALTAEAWMLGATEICMQGLAHRDLGATAYFDLARAVKAGAPGIHLHAFRPAELADGAARAGLSLDEYLVALRAAGVDSVPGTGARILDDAVRAELSASTDMPVAEWISNLTAAHRAGLRSTATMVYGHVESPAQQVAHLRALASIQDATGGFTEFIPMPFVAADAQPLPQPEPSGVDARRGSEAFDVWPTPSSADAEPTLSELAARRRSGPDLRETRAVHAVSRLMLAGRIDHIQAAWTKLGLATTTAVLRGGADDLGGLLLDGTLNPAAGPEDGRTLTVADAHAIAAALGREARQRTTLYETPNGE